jgi:LuxR family maltose regulon positive regulatory protein
VVLDDYHLINTKSIHDAMNFLIENSSPSNHLIIVGRADPPLPISRPRVHGEVTEIRTTQLRFAKEEVAAFLNDLSGLGLAP